MIEPLIQQGSPKTIALALALFAIVVMVKVSQWINTERKIRALGGHASKIRTLLPYGTSPFPSLPFHSTPFSHY
jgi:hypothetical protein